MPFTSTLPTASAGQIILGADITTMLSALHALSDPWASYTPSWASSGTQPGGGNGSRTGAYIQVGKFICYSINLTMGSSTTFGTGAYSFGLPVPNTGGTMVPVALATIFDTSAGTTFTRDGWTGTNTVALTDQSGNRVTNTAPMTFAVGDVIQIFGVYQAS